jgi:GNAT superfamily N-acetyltransferase
MQSIIIRSNKILDIWLRREQNSSRRSETVPSDTTASAADIRIRQLQTPQDTAAFRTLNEEWITRYFVLEAKDRETLGDPENTILRKGGYIFMVEVDGEPVGCAALIPMGNGVYELSKMAVSPRLRGLGIGRKLLEHVIAEAKGIGAKSLFLGSSTKLRNAVHLYESVGFRHVPPDKLPPNPYTRADVFMEPLL